METMSVHEWIAAEIPNAQSLGERRFFLRTLLNYVRTEPAIDDMVASLLEWLHDSDDLDEGKFQQTIDLAEGIIAQSLRER